MKTLLQLFLTRVGPKVHIKVFGNFHRYQAFVSTGR